MMEPREAIKVLLDMLKEQPLEAREKEAVRLALGSLDSLALGKTRMRGIANAIKQKREKDSFPAGDK